MKRRIGLGVSLVLVLQLLVGCGGNTNSNSNSNSEISKVDNSQSTTKVQENIKKISQN